MEADQDQDGKISFEEFTKMVENTDVSMSMTLGMLQHNNTYPASMLPLEFATNNSFSLRRSILNVPTASDTRGMDIRPAFFERKTG